jgi:hypothetical protein
VATGAAGSDDEFFEDQQRALNGIQFAREKNVILPVLLDGFRNRGGLFIDLPAHRMNKFAGWGGTLMSRAHVGLRRG